MQHRKPSSFPPYRHQSCSFCRCPRRSSRGRLGRTRAPRAATPFPPPRSLAAARAGRGSPPCCCKEGGGEALVILAPGTPSLAALAAGDLNSRLPIPATRRQICRPPGLIYSLRGWIWAIGWGIGTATSASSLVAAADGDATGRRPPPGPALSHPRNRRFLARIRSPRFPLSQ